MKKCVMESKSLIDFSSPVSKPLNTPLIPVPVAENKLSTSPTTNNPFDVVARQTLDAVLNDPFDNICKNALNNSNEVGGNSFNSQANQNERIESNLQVIEKDENLDSSTNKNYVSLSVLSDKDEESNKNGPSQVMENKEISIHKSISPTDNALLKSESKSQNHLETDSKSQISCDFSTEDSLKAVIAKRVNKCIEKALNNSINPKYSKSETNLKSSGSSDLMPFMSKRSASFITESTNHVKCDKMNKSCTDQCPSNESFALDNKAINTPESSIGSCDIKLLSNISGELSRLEDSVFERSETDQVFQEANKLARTFSKIAESFCNNADSDMEEDLMSCKPRWLYADSSEDEEEKLRKDPALNIRVSLPSPMTLPIPDSKALSAFKVKHGHSLSNLHSTMSEDQSIKRSNSVSARPNTSNAVPLIITPAPVAVVKPEENPIRLKKKSTTDSKRGGPMKAVMPIQIMTKKPYGKDDKIMHSRECSPIRRQLSLQTAGTPVKDGSQVGRPVASSTPNKSLTLLTPSIQVPSNKRRSLGSTLESRKSRPPVTESGSKQRSNSANSSIPTAAAVAIRALKPKPLLKEPLKPKSTSSLPRASVFNSQVNPRDRMSAKPTKGSSNPRALSDVMLKSSKSSLVKTAVTAISGVVRGKGKKMAAHDKENRLPV